jgi:hypothetical protein
MLDDSECSFPWGEEIEFNGHPSGNSSFGIKNEFLFADLLDDDLPLNLDFDTSGAFEHVKLEESHSSLMNNMCEISSQSEYLSGIDEVYPHEDYCKKSLREDRSLSPSPKRRCSISGSRSSSSADLSQNMEDHSLLELQNQYKRAVENLAMSMRRSELTRTEIANFRKAAETKAKLEAAQAYQFRNATGFLSGSRSTLTIGLEQSRQMLRNYMGVMTTPPL